MTGQKYICLLMMQKYVDTLQTDDYRILQETVDKIQHWSDLWLLKLNVDKCKIVSYGRQVEKNKYVMVQNNCIVELQRDAYVRGPKPINFIILITNIIVTHRNAR